MTTLAERVLDALQESPGLSDRELTDRLAGKSAGQQAVNQVARALAARDRLNRRRRPDGRIGNYPSDFSPPRPASPPALPSTGGPKEAGLSEDDVKRRLKSWLEAAGWQVEVKWGHDHGIDVVAKRGAETWLIEAKGYSPTDGVSNRSLQHRPA